MLHLCWNLTFFSQEVPLLHNVVEFDHGISEKIKGGLAEFGGAAGGEAASGNVISSSTVITGNANIYGNNVWSNNVIAGKGIIGGQEDVYYRYRAGVYDEMALSDQFLGEYYSSVSVFKFN